MTKFKVIDISVHNGDINWQKVKKDGIDGVIIRAGYGFWNRDKKLLENVKGCNDNNIPYGLYFYSYATNMNQARVEVKGFMKTISNLNQTLPVVVDTEDADGWRRKNGNPGWQLLADMAYMQLKELEKAGYYAMWYANLHWAKNLIKYNPRLKNIDLWLAHWNSTMGNAGMEVGIWQYTEKGPAYGNGIGSTDMNWAYKDYPSIIKQAGLNGQKKSSSIPKTQVENLRPKKKSNEELANEVIQGLWGSGQDRKNRLTKAGYRFNDVQAIVNKRFAKKVTNKKSEKTIAQEVIRGKWGNGTDRKKRLTQAGYNADRIQRLVNEMLK